ncbi:hypothetical protein M427DRAFT_230119 [Gonapodya prolifera JEL478]|uniref:Uncharacterized protein n=1 Tax=Gonapodya prolifera (strain JEL478) TaxID=1344416 RepID=A0A138ZY61_GONPJ|nr:hypothetical protein M427DRAFT_230119 [Gonapodya prolifera JEL478]|eukprot:KXS09438.1 hypothetical protein M427DRAFT_230119 [Gonapodya prolifera JEL478]
MSRCDCPAPGQSISLSRVVLNANPNHLTPCSDFPFTQKPSSSQIALSLAVATQSTLSITHPRVPASEMAFLDGEVPLAGSETPAIKRNKAMREEAGRRSSLGSRGRRTSSMHGNLRAPPHPDISPSEWYRHINPELPDPIRMRTLLMWGADMLAKQTKDRCEQRAGGKAGGAAVTGPTENEIAIMKAQQRVLENLMNKKTDVTWEHSRSDRAGTQQAKPKPNPQNVEVMERIRETEEEIRILEEEERAWDALNKDVIMNHARTVDAFPVKDRPFTAEEAEIDLSALNLNDREFVKEYLEEDGSTAGKEGTRSVEEDVQNCGKDVQQECEDLRLSVHRYQNTVHKIYSIQDIAMRYADDLFEHIAGAIEARESRGTTQPMEPMDLLRALAVGGK